MAMPAQQHDPPSEADGQPVGDAAAQQPSDSHGDDLLTPQEAAALLRVSAKTVIRMVQRGDLRGMQVGRQYRIPRDAIESEQTEKTAIALDDVREALGHLGGLDEAIIDLVRRARADESSYDELLEIHRSLRAVQRAARKIADLCELLVDDDEIEELISAASRRENQR